MDLSLNGSLLPVAIIVIVIVVIIAGAFFIQRSRTRQLPEQDTDKSTSVTRHSFTIATADGLVFGSYGGDAAQNDAATYSELFKNNPLVETPGIVLFGLTYKGLELIGIIRTKTPLPEKNVNLITEDTKVILDW
ncbi:MAG: hypothetical protein WC620_01875 [Methanoregula sp.]|jgi:amino acid transporter